MTATLHTISGGRRALWAALLALALLAGALAGGLGYFRKAEAASTINVGPAVDIVSDGTCSLLEAFDRVDELMGGGAPANTDCPQANSWPVTLDLATGFIYTLTANPNNNWAPANQETDTAFPRIQSSHQLIIQGNNATIERSVSAPLFRFFHLVNGTLALTNVTISQGSISGAFTVHGGAIHATGGTVTISGSKFNANSLTSRFQEGGAIYASNVTLSVSSSSFTNNVGNAWSHRGCAIAAYGGAVTITGSEFRQNSCQSGNNFSGNSGGAVWVSSGTQLSVADSTFIQNSILGHVSYGGAVAVDNSSATFDNTTFESNVAAQGNGAFAIGGAIGAWYSTVVVRNSTFTQNSANGGGGVDSSGGQLTVTNSTFHNNASTTHGGSAVRADTGTARLSFVTVFGGGPAAPVGVLGYANPTTVEVRNSVLATNLLSECSTVGSHATLSVTGTVLAANSCGTATVVPGLGVTLGPLANNGGPTYTIALLPGSPAINAVPAGQCTDPNGNPVGADQRGVGRPQLGQCDAGAFELQSSAQITVTKSASTTPVLPGGSFNWVITVAVAGGPTVVPLDLADTLPSGFTYGTVSASPPLNCTLTGLSLSCTLQANTPNGTYTVTIPVTVPTNNPGLCGTTTNTVTYTGEADGSASGDVTVGCTGSVRVHKVYPAGVAPDGQTFTGSITGATSYSWSAAVGSSATVSGVLQGAYTVTESGPPPGYQLVGMSTTSAADACSDNAPDSVSVNVAAGQTSEVWVCNQPFGTVVIVKYENVPPAAPQTWTFTGTIPGLPQVLNTTGTTNSVGTNIATLAGVPAGSYTVAETQGRGQCQTGATSSDWETRGLVQVGGSQPDANALNSAPVIGSGSLNVPVQAGQTTYVVFGNIGCGSVLSAANLQVNKFSDPLANFTGTTPLGGWTITITGTAGTATGFTTSQLTSGAGQAFFLGIPDGTYTVCETLQSGWANVGSKYNTVTQAGVCRTGVTVNLNQTATVNFYNQPRVNIQVIKKLNIVGFTSNGAGWEFTLTGCGITPQKKTTDASGIAEFTDLPPAIGCQYTVTETVQSGWTPQFVSQTAQPVAGGQVVTLEFLNIRNFDQPCVDPNDPRCVPPPSTPTPTPGSGGPGSGGPGSGGPGTGGPGSGGPGSGGPGSGGPGSGGPGSGGPGNDGPGSGGPGSGGPGTGGTVTQVAGERTPGPGTGVVGVATPLAPSAGTGLVDTKGGVNLLLVLAGLVSLSVGLGLTALRRPRKR